MTWIILWKLVLIITLVAFSCMTICVTLGGAGDVRLLFRRLREAEDRDD